MMLSARNNRRTVALLSALALVLTIASVIISVKPAHAGVPTVCFTVADRGPGPTGDYLVSVDRTTGLTTGIGFTGTTAIEAMAMEPGGNRLFATNAAQFGEVDMTTGAFTPIGPGVGMGFNDVDSLMFDPFTFELWAADRNGGADDTLFRIDPATGLGVPGSAVTINSFAVTGLYDIDDLAISPYDGELYAINNQSTNDKLVTIDRVTGAVAVVIDIQADYPAAQDMEGLTFTNDGVMYGSDGDGAPNGDMWLIDPLLGTVTFFTDLGPGGDFESIGCLTADLNTITGTVFFDTNADGALDGGDTGEGSVTVRLYRDINADGVLDGGDALVNTTDTAGDGTYSFPVAANLPFVIDVDTADLPVGFHLTTDNLETATFTGYGQTDSGNNFGYAMPVILADFVWDDLDADGIQDGGEPGLAGVTVNLLDGTGTPLGPTTTTAADGSYLFANLGPGTYAVEFVAPVGWLRSPADQGGDDAVDSDADGAGQTPPVTLAANESDFTIDAGFFDPGTIGDFVWDDLNGDGVQDVGEPGRGGVTVTLSGAASGSTTTAGDGSYSFTGLAAGSYAVSITVPGGLTLTTADPVNIALAAGATDLTADFGLYDPSTASIDIEKDPDPQTILSGGTANWTITVTNTGSVDLSNVAVTDALAPDCDSAIGGLSAGANTSYACSLASVSASFTNSAGVTGDDPLSNTVTDTDTADVVVDDSSATIGDTVFYDSDGDGVQDAGEPGIEQVTVQLLDNTATLITTTNTNTTGQYSFGGLAAADYSVEIVPPSGTSLTSAANPWPVTLAAGVGYADADFGMIGTGSIGQIIWLDSNENGLLDGGETGTAGVAVSAVWAGIDGTIGTSDDLVFSSVTNSSGNYSITGLPAGLYEVTVNGATLPSGYQLTFTPDGDTNLTDSLVLGAGASVSNENFGYSLPPSLPVTGVDVDRLLGFAIAIMAMGLAVVYIGRRRLASATLRH